MAETAAPILPAVRTSRVGRDLDAGQQRTISGGGVSRRGNPLTKAARACRTYRVRQSIHLRGFIGGGGGAGITNSTTRAIRAASRPLLLDVLPAPPTTAFSPFSRVHRADLKRVFGSKAAVLNSVLRLEVVIPYPQCSLRSLTTRRREIPRRPRTRRINSLFLRIKFPVPAQKSPCSREKVPCSHLRATRCSGARFTARPAGRRGG